MHKPRMVGLNHVAIEVGDIEEALAFYGRIFQFTLRGKGKTNAFIDMGDQFINLTQVSAEHRDSPRHFGLFRPGSSLSCVTADALVALYNPNLARASFSPPGIEIERSSFAMIPAFVGRIACPYCGGEHEWSKDTARIVDDGDAAP